MNEQYLGKTQWMPLSYVEGLVTVIITSYQRADYVVATANSIYNQTYRPIELIIIDDGSTDNTKETLLAWREKIEENNNFTFNYIYQENTGAPKARNRALSLSKGEFIQEVGSDDLIHPLKLEAQVKLLNSNKTCQSVWNPLLRFTNDLESSLFSKNITISNLADNPIVINRSENLFKPEFFPSAGLHRRSVFYYSGPWHTELKRWQDLEYQTRMSYNVSKYFEIEEPLYFFRQHNGERINSQYNQEKGIDSGLQVLEQIEINLTRFGVKNLEMSLEMCNFYITLILLSAKFSSKKQLFRAISGALRHRKSWKFKVKMSIFFIISIFNSKTAYNLFSFLKKP